MTTVEKLELLYASDTPPIYPTRDIEEFNEDTNPGYRFYLKLRKYLPEWWEEFNGDLDEYGRLKYVTIRDFIKKKASKSEERRWLYQMLGPAIKYQNGDRETPWLGDWEKRRRAGFGVLDDPAKMKPLIKAIENNLAAVESIRALTPFLAEDLAQYSTLQRQVHEAYAGRAFNKKEAHDKKNVERFKQYKEMLWALSECKFKVIAELMRVHGVNPNTPEQMREIAQIAGGIGAAAALMGNAAGQALPPGTGASVPIQTPTGQQMVPFTYDALMLAGHLTQHAHTFKKPLPVIEGVTAKEDEPSSSASSSSSHKGNGRMQ